MSEVARLIESLSPDRQELLDALLQEELVDPEWLRAEYRAPRTAHEKALIRVFEEVLGIPGIGVRHNFFDLGGDSIHSIHIAAKARRAGLHITTRDVFEHPTIEQLAARANHPGPPDESALAASFDGAGERAVPPLLGDIPELQVGRHSLR